MPRTCLLYYITDRTSLRGDETSQRQALLLKIAEAARCGVDYIQLREKNLSTRQLEALALKAMQVVRQNSCIEPATRLFINSRLDVALAVDADGVHLRSDDISPEEVQMICDAQPVAGPACLITGVSCHTEDEVRRAEARGASFAVFGPVFEKSSVPQATPTGLSRLKEACRNKLPVLALGGMTLENAQVCLKAGARGIAGIRLFQNHDIAGVVRQLRDPAV